MVNVPVKFGFITIQGHVAPRSLRTNNTEPCARHTQQGPTSVQIQFTNRSSTSFETKPFVVPCTIEVSQFRNQTKQVIHESDDIDISADRESAGNQIAEALFSVERVNTVWLYAHDTCLLLIPEYYPDRRKILLFKDGQASRSFSKP